MNNFTKRLITSVVFLAAMLAALLVHEYVFGAVMLAILAIMMGEFLKMTCGAEYRYSQIFSIITGATMFTLAFFHAKHGLDVRFFTLALLPLFTLMVNSLYVKDKTRFEKFACLYTAIIYIAIPWSVINYAAFSADGTFCGKLLLCFFAIVWGSDVGAYCFGVTLGRKFGRKLFPSISPNKSWVGFWGGLATAIAVSCILQCTGVFTFPLYHCILLAIVLNVSGVYGDLIESQWKRHYEVKDSGRILPGHGGMLDRFDSSLLAVPCGVIYLTVMNLL